MSTRLIPMVNPKEDELEQFGFASNPKRKRRKSSTWSKLVKKHGVMGAKKKYRARSNAPKRKRKYRKRRRNVWYNATAAHSRAAKKGWRRRKRRRNVVTATANVRRRRYRKRRRNVWAGASRRHSIAAKKGWRRRRRNVAGVTPNYYRRRRRRRRRNPIVKGVMSTAKMALQFFLGVVASRLVGKGLQRIVKREEIGYGLTMLAPLVPKMPFSKWIAIGGGFNLATVGARRLGSMLRDRVPAIPAFLTDALMGEAEVIILPEEEIPELPYEEGIEDIVIGEEIETPEEIGDEDYAYEDVGDIEYESAGDIEYEAAGDIEYEEDVV